jgi:hypothetical protein
VKGVIPVTDLGQEIPSNLLWPCDMYIQENDHPDMMFLNYYDDDNDVIHM